MSSAVSSNVAIAYANSQRGELDVSPEGGVEATGSNSVQDKFEVLALLPPRHVWQSCAVKI